MWVLVLWMQSVVRVGELAGGPVDAVGHGIACKWAGGPTDADSHGS